MTKFENNRIAILIPCFNEAVTIKSVVDAFSASVPEATIYVYDNNSTDDTASLAEAAGAIVRRETRQGKGNVVRRMFADIDADIYLMVDGDATYDAEAAPRLIEELLAGPYDTVNGARCHATEKAYRPGHMLGNRLLSWLVSYFFGRQSRDMLSGYKAMSRRFVKTFPTSSRGFEIETELLVHALELKMPVSEIETRYFERPAGSASKLSTYKDGIKIIWVIMHLIRDLLPLKFFFSIAASLALVAAVMGVPVVLDFFNTGLVQRVPTLIAATAIMILSVLSFFAAIILDSVARGRREMKLLAYLSYSAVRT